MEDFSEPCAFVINFMSHGFSNDEPRQALQILKGFRMLQNGDMKMKGDCVESGEAPDQNWMRIHPLSYGQKVDYKSDARLAIRKIKRKKS